MAHYLNPKKELSYAWSVEVVLSSSELESILPARDPNTIKKAEDSRDLIYSYLSEIDQIATGDGDSSTAKTLKTKLGILNERLNSDIDDFIISTKRSIKNMVIEDDSLDEVTLRLKLEELSVAVRKLDGSSIVGIIPYVRGSFGKYVEEALEMFKEREKELREFMKTIQEPWKVAVVNDQGSIHFGNLMTEWENKKNKADFQAFSKGVCSIAARDYHKVSDLFHEKKLLLKQQIMAKTTNLAEIRMLTVSELEETSRKIDVFMTELKGSMSPLERVIYETDVFYKTVADLIIPEMTGALKQVHQRTQLMIADGVGQDFINSVKTEQKVFEYVRGVA